MLPDRGVPARLGWAALVLALAILAVPVLVAPIPPLTDYPNHLSRLWLLSGGPGVADVARFYRLQFDTFTNIGIDLLALTAGRIGGYEFAGRASIVAAILLPAMGGTLLWRAVHGRFHWWMLSFGLLVWGQNLLDGFLNFQISIGLALLFAACEPAIERRRPASRVAVRVALGFVLILAHPFGFIFYGLLVGALILGPRVSTADRDHWRAVSTRLGIALLGLAIVLAVFVIAVPRLPGAQENSGLGTLSAEFRQGFADFRFNPAKKLLNVMFAVRAYSNRADLLTLLVLALPIALAGFLRCLRVHAGLGLLSVGLLIVYLLCPDYLLGAYWVDVRFAVMLPFVLAAALWPALPAVPARIAAAVLALAAIGRTAMIGMIWHERQADVASVASALEAVPAGAAVLPVEQRPADRGAAPIGRFTTIGENSFRHLPALAVPWRHAFVPILFAARGKQPIAVVPPWDEIAEPNGGQLADVHALDQPPLDDMAAARAPYVTEWRTRFDYLLVIQADMPDRYGPFVPPAALTLVRDAGFAKLYRITPP